MKSAEYVVTGVVVLVLMQAALTFSPAPDDGFTAARVTLTAGFVLLCAWAAGRFVSAFRLPKLTGYLFTGVACGPALSNLISEPMIDELRFINGAAVALIALTAGGELDLREQRPLLKTVLAIGVVCGAGGAAIVAGVILLARPLFPFMVDMPWAQAIAIAAVLGVTVIAQSPAVVVALRSETDARGPITQTILGVVVLGDLLVIGLFAITSAIARALLGGAVDAWETTRAIAWELFGSLALGAVLGGILAAYLRRVQHGVDVVVLALCLLVAEIGPRLSLDPLLVMIAAGVVVENVGEGGKKLIARIEASSLPVYVLFFTLAGASIHLDALASVAIPVGLLVLVRAGALLGGSNLATRLVGSPPQVRKWAGFGLLPQAGLAIALSLLFARTFPSLGDTAAALTLGVVAVNELVAPAVLRWAWVRSGEGRQLDDTVDPATQSSENIHHVSQPPPPRGD
jgi:Kef-type K+ transport system membrane component KefB